MSEEKHDFQAEVSKLLDIVAHSLYSEKEVFLRELISNASDACDRLRYLAITQPELISDDPEFRIRISLDAKQRTLTIADNGIGMSHDELIENLGTIARSGTTAFLENMQADANRQEWRRGGSDRAVRRRLLFRLHGRRRRRGDQPQGRRGRHLGLAVGRQGRPSPSPAAKRIHWTARAARGSCCTSRRRTRISPTPRGSNRSSGAIPTTSRSPYSSTARPKDGEEPVKVNAASALWTRAKSDIEDEQYTEFYGHVSHAFDEPWLTLHTKAEGKIEYNALLFVPTNKPFDLFEAGTPWPGEALRQARVHHRGLRRSAAGVAALPARRVDTRTCRSTSAARCCSTIRCWRGSARA